MLFENGSRNVLEISLKCPPELQRSVTHVVTRSRFPAKVISLKESAARNLTARQETNKLFLSFGSFFSLANLTLFFLFFFAKSQSLFWQLPWQPDEINTAADRLRQSTRFPPSLPVFLTSPSLSLSPPNITMHLASPAATVWCSRPPPVHLYPTFISVSVFPSIHLCGSSGGRGGFESLSVLPCEGESYGGFERESALLWVLYDISFPVRVTKEVHSPRSSLKTPALSYKVPLCTARTEQDGDPSGELVIKHLPLLNMSTHFHSNPLPPFLASPSLPTDALLLTERKWNAGTWKGASRPEVGLDLSQVFFFFFFRLLSFFYPHRPILSVSFTHSPWI